MSSVYIVSCLKLWDLCLMSSEKGLIYASHEKVGSVLKVWHILLFLLFLLLQLPLDCLDQTEIIPYTHSNAPVKEQTEAAYASWSQPPKAAVVLERVTRWLLRELPPQWHMWEEQQLLPHQHLLCGCFPSVKMKSDEFRTFLSGFPPLRTHFVLRAETYWFCAWKEKKILDPIQI